MLIAGIDVVFKNTATLVECIANLKAEARNTQFTISPIVCRTVGWVELGRLLRIMPVIVGEFVAHDTQTGIIGSIVISVAPGPKHQARIAVQVDEHAGGSQLINLIRWIGTFLIRENARYIIRDAKVSGSEPAVGPE